MGIEITTVETCTCPWCAPAPQLVPIIPEIAGGGTPLLPPPLPPTTTYATAVWNLAPPTGGTNDVETPLAMPVPPWLAPAATTPVTTTRPQPQLPLVPVGTPFADAIGFTNPFLE